MYRLLNAKLFPGRDTILACNAAFYQGSRDQQAKGFPSMEGHRKTSGIDWRSSSDGSNGSHSIPMSPNRESNIFSREVVR